MTEQSMQQMQQMQGGLGSLGIVPIIIMLALYVFFAWCMARIAVKTGMPLRSAFIWAVIPIANILLLIKIANKPMWWLILLFIPIANIVVSILIWMAISERLGKPGWWGILIALVPIVNIVLFLILAFEKPTTATA
ncbi:MAG: DUF5684 domain-containing protein [bacterium]